MRAASLLSALLLPACFSYDEVDDPGKTGDTGSTKTTPEETGDSPPVETSDTAPPALLIEITSLAPASNGRINLLSVAQASPDASLRAWTEGAPHVPLDGCPGVEVDAGAEVVVASADGTARLPVMTPPTPTVTFSVAQSEGCLVSEPVIFDLSDTELLSASNGAIFEGLSDNDRAGVAVAVADLDGDGYAEAIVGASSASDAGAVYLFDGAPANVFGAVSETLQGSLLGGGLGYTLSSADPDGDGDADLLVGEPFGGNVYWYSSEAGSVFGAGPRQTISGSVWPGSSLSGGDVDGDGDDDLLLGAPLAGFNGSGAAYLVLGDPDPVELLSLESAYAVFSGEADNDYAGFGSSIAEDTNGDGYDDIVVGSISNAPAYPAPCAYGAAYLVEGDNPAPSTRSLADADAIRRGENDCDSAGGDIASGGDVDGDGYGDVLVSASEHDSDTGRVYLVPGPWSGDTSLSASRARLDGESPGDHAGDSIASAGDLDGDGYNDILVGSPYHTAYPFIENGRTYLVYGPVIGDVGLGDSDLVITGDAPIDRLGSSLAAGDVDGDGYGDLLSGAAGFGYAEYGTGYIVVTTRGRASLISGSLFVP